MTLLERSIKLGEGIRGDSSKVTSGDYVNRMVLGVIDSKETSLKEEISLKKLGFTQIKTEGSLGSMEHTNKGYLMAIEANSMKILTNDLVIDNEDIYNDLENQLRDTQEIDFSKLLLFIKENYRSTDLENNIHYIKLFEIIEKLKENLEISNEEKFLKEEINKEDLKKWIYNYESIVGSDKRLSNIGNISDGYYINFELESYLGDIFKIEPILIELIDDLVGNSIKYSDKGTEIRVSVTQTVDNIVISVLDEGYGIKQEDKNKVFEDKVRLGNVGNERGSGQGGSKCAYCVNKLGGEIYIRSKVGIGTEIKIILPN